MLDTSNTRNRYKHDDPPSQETYMYGVRDNSEHGLSNETNCNVVSHWLSPYSEWFPYSAFLEYYFKWLCYGEFSLWLFGFQGTHLVLNYYDIEESGHGDCEYDRIVIYRRGEETLRLCGSSDFGEDLGVVSGPIYISFKSDYSVKQRGFEIAFRAVSTEDCDSDSCK